jgi:hypothetical protein
LGGTQGRELAHMPKAAGKCACLDLQWLAGEQQPPYCPQPPQSKIPMKAHAANLLDVSVSGVHLLVKGSIAGLDLKEFFLRLSSTGLADRRCELAKSKGRLTGIVELRTEGGHLEMGIDEDAALALRTDLERFLTQ